MKAVEKIDSLLQQLTKEELIAFAYKALGMAQESHTPILTEDDIKEFTNRSKALDNGTDKGIPIEEFRKKYLLPKAS